MTKMFGNMTKDGLEASGDRIGGGGLFDSGVYTGKVKLAYAGKSAGGAAFMAVHLDLGGKEYRETIYISNKAGENFYVDKNDPKKKQPMPGFVTIDELCMMTTGLPLAEQDFTDKVVSLYDFDTKKDVPQNVPCMLDVMGKDITVAIFKDTVDKQEKDSQGQYQNTGKTREENVIDKFFHADSGRTTTECLAGMETAIFLPKWKEKNTGVTRDRVKGAAGKSGVPGGKAGGSLFQAGAANGNQGAPAKKSIFG